MFKRGEAIRYDNTGETGVVKSRGHFPDTIIVSIGEPRRDAEVYLRSLTLLDDIPAPETIAVA